MGFVTTLLLWLLGLCVSTGLTVGEPQERHAGCVCLPWLKTASESPRCAVPKLSCSPVVLPGPGLTVGLCRTAVPYNVQDTAARPLIVSFRGLREYWIEQTSGTCEGHQPASISISSAETPQQTHRYDAQTISLFPLHVGSLASSR